MYVHFEGLDLAGKSTICRLFREQAGGEWAIHHNALLADNPICALADRLRREGGGEESVGWLYHAALLFDLERFAPTTGNVLQDSTILLRSLAYHKVRGTAGLVERLETLLGRHPRFDRSFVLVADHTTRLHRLGIRRPQNLSPEDFLVRDEPARFYAMERVLVEYATSHFGATVLDTSGTLDANRLEPVFHQLPGPRPDQAGD
ncbi:MAG: hypothetical protein U0840_12350 [Gemmataceae bacterium]